jgi:hypothetical protein
LARYLYEAQIVPASRDYWDLINEICWASRGMPDSPSNAYTTFAEAEQSLAYYHIPINYTDSYSAAASQAWSIVYCDGRYLNPDAYPDSWFGGPNPSGNHFILWLPFWKGSSSWLNNPLVPQQLDMQQSIDMYYGAYLLPETGNGESGPERKKVSQECGLKAVAAHGGENMYLIPKDGQLMDQGVTKTTDDVWSYVQYMDKWGYVPKAYIVPL